MAVIKLGAFVTAISGSVGGTTFKRNGSNVVMLNKVGGASKSKTYLNKRLNGLSNIIRSWTALSGTNKASWNDEATKILFPDKFGGTKYLSGRQLFTKLNGQLLVIPDNKSSASGIVTSVGEIIVQDIYWDYTSPLWQITTELATADIVWVLFQIEIWQGGFRSPTFTAREVFFRQYNEGLLDSDVKNSVLNKYPFLTEDYQVRIYVTAMNTWGFRSTPYVKLVTWN